MRFLGRQGFEFQGECYNACCNGPEGDSVLGYFLPPFPQEEIEEVCQKIFDEKILENKTPIINDNVLIDLEIFQGLGTDTNYHISYSIVGQYTRLSSLGPGFKSRWENIFLYLLFMLLIMLKDKNSTN